LNNNIIITGFGSAGYAALMAIKKTNPKSEITVIDPKPHDLMHPCGLPYSLENIINKKDLYQDINLSGMGVKKIQGEVTGINEDNSLECMSDGRNSTLNFSSLVITAGSQPFVPGIKGLSEFYNKSIFNLTSVTELLKIIEKINHAQSGAVVGAGAIGLESAVAMKNTVNEVRVFEAENQILSGILDPDIAKILEDSLLKQNIHIHKNFKIEKIIKKKDLNNGFSLNNDSGDFFEADTGILATGFRPNISIAENSSIDCNANGIIVNNRMMTVRKNIFAAGDIISGWSVIDGKKLNSKLATSAYKQGTIAGLNCAGKSAIYNGSAGTFVSKIGKLEIAGTGYNTATAIKKGFQPVSGKIKSGILPDYFPDNTEITIKVIIDKITGKFLGAQAIGEKGAAERINIISAAIEFNITADRIGSLEMAYCPAVSEVYDPVFRAIDFAIRRTKKK